MRNILIPILLIFLVGCANPNYDGYGSLIHPDTKGKRQSEVATVTTAWVGKDIQNVKMYMVFDVEKKKDAMDMGITGQGLLTRITLLPGEYIFMAHCTGYNWTASPQVKLNILANHSYKLVCKAVNKNTYKLEVESQQNKESIEKS